MSAMPDQTKAVVINTTPLIALTAATGNLDVLRCLYSRVVVPYEVAKEIRAGGRDAFGVEVFEQASWLDISPEPMVLMPYLQNTLDSGEASVIQTALQLGINLVCIDEPTRTKVAQRQEGESAQLRRCLPLSAHHRSTDGDRGNYAGD